MSVGEIEASDLLQIIKNKTVSTARVLNTPKNLPITNFKAIHFKE